MLSVQIREVDTMNLLSITCPECGMIQFQTIPMLCDECYYPIPTPTDVLTELSHRLGFYKGQDPWEV